MSIGFGLVDYNEMFSRADPSTILVVNDLDPSLVTHRETIKNQLVTSYEGDSLSVVPSCDCGHITGGYNIGRKCPHCFTLVTPPTERAVDSTVWMRVPDGVHRFIHPGLYKTMRDKYSSKGLNLLDWLLRLPTPKNVSVDDHPGVIYLRKHGFRRGVNAFYEQFDKFLELGFNSAICKGSEVGKKSKLLEFADTIYQHRDKMFCTHIPLPSRLAFVVEMDGNHGYVDRFFYKCMDAVMTIADLKVIEMNLNMDDPKVYSRVIKRREDRAAQAIKQLSSFYTKIGKSDLGDKTGRFRNTLFGSRLHHTFRAVITSISGPHHKQDLHLPWSLAVNVFTLYIKNKLLKEGYTPSECSKMINMHSNIYSPHIHSIINEIIDEHPCKGFPVIFQRNPTLDRLGAQQLFVTKVKDDLADKSISMSILVLKGPNADEDL